MQTFNQWPTVKVGDKVKCGWYEDELHEEPCWEYEEGVVIRLEHDGMDVVYLVGDEEHVARRGLGSIEVIQ